MTTETNQQTIDKVIDVQKAKSDLVSNLKKLKEFYLYLKLDNVSLIDKVVERVENHSFSVAVVGMFRTGKSTFINALLGRDILPSDVTPTTATINRVTYGVTPSAKIFFKDGREEEVDINQLKDYVTELTVEAKKTSSEVKEAVIYYPSHYCENDVDIIDTPGLNEEANMDQVTFSVLPEVDAAIMVISSLAPFSDLERKFIEEKLMTSDLGRIIFVVNIVDHVHTTEENEKIVKFIRNKITEYVMERAKKKYGKGSADYEIYQKKIGTPKVFGLSAKTALNAKTHDPTLLAESHFPEFETALDKFLAEERGATILQVPVNRTIASATAIFQAISLQENGLAMDKDKCIANCDKAVAEIKVLQSQKALEMEKIDSAAKKVKETVLPIVERFEGELKQAATQVISTMEIDPSELDDKKSLQAKLSCEVSETVKKAAQKIAVEIQEQIEHGLVNEVYRLQDFAKSFDEALQNIEMSFISVDANTHEERDPLVGGLAAALAVFTGFGGIWSGWDEGGAIGSVIGAAGSFGTLFVIGAILAVFELPITLPIVIIAGITTYFTGGWITKEMFGGHQVARFKENYEKGTLQSIENQLKQSHFDRQVNQQIDKTFDALKQKLQQEVNAMLENTQSTITDLRRKQERDIVLNETHIQELKQMKEDTKQIQSSAQWLSQVLTQQVNKDKQQIAI